MPAVSHNADTATDSGDGVMRRGKRAAAGVALNAVRAPGCAVCVQPAAGHRQLAHVQRQHAAHGPAGVAGRARAMPRQDSAAHHSSVRLRALIRQGPLDNAADGASCCCSPLRCVSFVTLTGWGSAAYHHNSVTANAAEVNRCVTY
jgi:hypothetical protein